MAKLQIIKSNELVHEIQLDTGNEYLAGRQGGCDIQLEGLPGISRQHFKVIFDGSNWKVDCLSEVKVTEFNGVENEAFELIGNCSFTLSPYRFAFFAEEQNAEASAQNETSILQDSPDLDDMDYQGDSEDEPEAAHFPEESPHSPPASENTLGNGDEATSIKSFQGSPYLKVMGAGKRKTEYYRLEGQLWVAGSDQNAAIFLPDTKVAAAHFEISKNERGFEIIDLGSATGTMVNGQHISTSTKTDLASGDFINVGGLTLQFELRDQSFKERVESIPLHMYENPLVFFGQEAGMINTGPEVPKHGKAEEIQRSPMAMAPSKRKNTLVKFGVVIAILIGVMMSLDNSTKEKSKQPAQNLDPFQKLSKNDQKIVKSTYDMAKKLYLNSQFELALSQFENLHRILDSGYLDSKQIEEYCINNRDLQQQKAEIDRQRREQQQIKRKVQFIIGECSKRFTNSSDMSAAQSCLSEAIQLDPNNPGINDILSRITARQEMQATALKVAKQKEELANRGRTLYLKAKALHDAQNLPEAINAYESHIGSGLPDPTGLVAKSKRKLSSIQRQIRARKQSLVTSARTELQAANLKKAITLARKARKVDPYDREIAYFLRDIEGELRSKMKIIYMDSVIEERFGNIEASRDKWNQIIAADIEDGEYYKRAQRKLALYGF